MRKRTVRRDRWAAIGSIRWRSFLACFDTQWQLVFRRRERAHGVRGERTRRIERLIEVEQDAPLCRAWCVEEAPGTVGFVTAGEVRKEHEEALVAVLEERQ